MLIAHQNHLFGIYHLFFIANGEKEEKEQKRKKEKKYLTPEEILIFLTFKLRTQVLFAKLKQSIIG